MCKCISITEDQRVEAAEEQFVVKLESLAPNITTTDEKAVATIIDRDGMLIFTSIIIEGLRTRVV